MKAWLIDHLIHAAATLGKFVAVAAAVWLTAAALLGIWRGIAWLLGF